MSSHYYRCPPGLQWVNEHNHILVINPDGGKAHHLSGVEAALWDWIMLGYGNFHLEQFLAAALDLPTNAAVDHLQEALDEWCAAGLLLEVEAVDG